MLKFKSGGLIYYEFMSINIFLIDLKLILNDDIKVIQYFRSKDN